MKYNRIYLTGFMGSGKSTVGELLADQLDLPFTDLESKIAVLLAEKEGFYEQAHWSLDTDDLAPDEAALAIRYKMMEDTGG